ncbi:MAG: hypothetical protein ACKOJF_17060 [Planctomycetaceae bacterium]
MLDRLVTVLLSVVATLAVQSFQSAGGPPVRELEVDRLVVRRELIVSDTGEPWEAGYERQQLARGLYARALHDGPGGLWVRSRLIKGELDDPFDDRFHALERDGSLRTAPGHISWNVWLDDAWRQVAIVQGEGVEFSETPREQWNGVTHPGRIRFQTFRPGHQEPLTDALIGQGRMTLGGGGYGGGGLPEPRQVLELWGGRLVEHPLPTPASPERVRDDGSGRRRYALVAISATGARSPASPELLTDGFAELTFDSVPGADAYQILRDGEPLGRPVRIEGSKKTWRDPAL